MVFYEARLRWARGSGDSCEVLSYAEDGEEEADVTACTWFDANRRLDLNRCGYDRPMPNR